MTSYNHQEIIINAWPLDVQGLQTKFVHVRRCFVENTNQIMQMKLKYKIATYSTYVTTINETYF